MTSAKPPLIVAAVQHPSAFLNRRDSVAKACAMIAEAAAGGARLVVFPEAFVPGYPDWVWLVKNSDGAALSAYYRELLDNSVSVPDASTEALCRAARESGVCVAIGINERNAESSGSSLFNTLLYISHRGEILGAHRKLIPTGGERTVWARGDGSTLRTYDTCVGRLGGLLCWENYMPLARQALYQQGVQVYAAPTWDSSEPWLLAMRYIAREGGMFVVNCCQGLRAEDIPDRYAFKSLYPEGREWINPGNSCIIDPMGRLLAGPAKATQEILYAELDLGLVADAKRMFDVAGHYSRPDVLRFAVAGGGSLGSGQGAANGLEPAPVLAPVEETDA